MSPTVRRWLDLKTGEGALVLLCALYVGFITASFLLARPIRNALFLREYGAYRLVYVYVAVPVVLTLVIPAYNALSSRIDPRRVLAGALVFCAAVFLAFWYALRFVPFGGLSALFYLWVSLFGAVAPVHAWALIGSLFDTQQAKRLFGLIGAGAPAGAIAGGLMASTLAGPVGSANLLLVLVGLSIGAATCVGLIRGRAPDRGLAVRAGSQPPFRQTLARITERRYLTLIAALVFIVAIVTQWVGFQLSLVADARFAGDADRLTQFFGQFNFLTGVIALLMQLFVTGPALRRYGLALTLMLLPLSLGAGSLLVLLAPGFLAVMWLNASDQCLRFSVDKASYELLYLPLPVAVRAQVKGAVDMLGNRVADAIGGLLLGLITQGFLMGRGLQFELQGLALLSGLLILAWMAIASRLRREYVEAIRDSIQKHRIDTEQAALAATVLDRSTRKIVTTRLETREPDELLYALDLLEVDHTVVPHPALYSLLGHPSPEIRRRVVALLTSAGDKTVAPQIEALLHDDDLAVRTEALLYLSRTFGIDPLEKVTELGDVAGFSIRAGMVAFLARPGPTQNLDAARAILAGMANEADPEGARARLEAARLIERLPDEFEDELQTLLQDHDVAVVKQTCRAVSKLRKVELGGRVAQRLGDRELRDEAAKTLCQFGEPVVPFLRALLLDEQAPIEIRREIPGVLALIGTVSAQEVLFESLLQGDSTLRHGIITSLNQLRDLHPQTTFDPDAVEMLLLAEITGHYRSYQVLGALGDSSSEQPVVAGLRQSMRKELERIFRLLGLLARQDDLHSAYIGLQSTDPIVRSNALEFLEHVLRPQLRNLIVPIVDGQVTEGERVELANRLVGAPVESVEQALAALLGSEDSWLKSCAAYAVGNLHIESLHADLDRWANHSDPLVRETVRAAQRRLGTRREAEAEIHEATVGLYGTPDDIGVG